MWVCECLLVLFRIPISSDFGLRDITRSIFIGVATDHQDDRQISHLVLCMGVKVTDHLRCCWCIVGLFFWLRMSFEEMNPDTDSDPDSSYVEAVQVLKDNDKQPKRKTRRKAGELSGRQLAIKKLEKEEDELWPCPLPPPCGWVVKNMQRVLWEFADGKPGNITKVTASAMRVYSAKKLGIETKVSYQTFA